ncbi:MAG: hypothetical protein JKX93_08350 [Rhizobiaceae bacterium]|nr:hypothetical protein [Rhizobiaceae bacterium]MBL4695704.1 hypothetical protein [Rhizobiaceae bacterium]
MAHLEKVCVSNISYTVIGNARRLVERDFRTLSASVAATDKLRKSPFFKLAGASGQELAGSGALVFEGELLEFPRKTN